MDGEALASQSDSIVTATRSEGANSGECFQAFDGRLAGTEEPVRIRVLDPEVDSPEVRSAMLDRIRQWSKASTHPNVRTVYEWGTDPVPWIAIERTDEVALADVLTSVTGDETLTLLAEAAEGVRNAGLYDVSHGNLDPRWLSVAAGEDARCVVDDWGVERAVKETVDGEFSTPYTAPEQRDGGTTDARTDVYGLAAVGYHALTGTLTDDDDGHLPEALVGSFDRALSTDPDDRHSTVHAFRTDIVAAATDAGFDTDASLDGIRDRLAHTTPENIARDDGKSEGAESTAGDDTDALEAAGTSLSGLERNHRKFRWWAALSLSYSVIVPIVLAWLLFAQVMGNAVGQFMTAAVYVVFPLFGLGILIVLSTFSPSWSPDIDERAPTGRSQAFEPDGDEAWFYRQVAGRLSPVRRRLLSTEGRFAGALRSRMSGGEYEPSDEAVRLQLDRVFTVASLAGLNAAFVGLLVGYLVVTTFFAESVPLLLRMHLGPQVNQISNLLKLPIMVMLGALTFGTMGFACACLAMLSTVGVQAKTANSKHTDDEWTAGTRLVTGAAYGPEDILIRPHRYLRDHPSAVLLVTAPLSAAVVVAAMMLGWAPSPVPLIGAENDFVTKMANNPARGTFFWVHVPLVLNAVPLAGSYWWNRRYRERADDELLDALGGVAEDIEGEGDLPDVLAEWAESTDGVAGQELESLRARVQAGESLYTAIRGVASRYRTPGLQWLTGHLAGTDDPKHALATGVEAGREAKEARNEWIASRYLYLAAAVGAFTVGIGLLLVLKVELLDYFQGIAQRSKPPETVAGGQFSGGFGPASMWLLHTMGVQSVFLGLVTGLIDRNSFRAGLKYAVVFLLVALFGYAMVSGGSASIGANNTTAAVRMLIG